MLFRRDFVRHLLLFSTSGAVGLGAVAAPLRALAAPDPPTPAATPTYVPGATVTAIPKGTATPTPGAAPAIVPTATPTPVAQAWVQALRSIPLWSGPDDGADQFGFA